MRWMFDHQTCLTMWKNAWDGEDPYPKRTSKLTDQKRSKWHQRGYRIHQGIRAREERPSKTSKASRNIAPQQISGFRLPPLSQQTRLQTLFKPGCTHALTVHDDVEKFGKPIKT
jgi:hypothetical protein